MLMSENGLLSEFRVDIGGIKINIASSDKMVKFKRNNAFNQFLTKEAPEVRLIFHCQKFQLPLSRQIVFDPEGCWKLFDSEQGPVFGFYSPDYGESAYKIALMQNNLLKGDVYSCLVCEEDKQSYNPLDYPLDEVLMVNLLGKKRGIMMHASGMNINGSGMIFSGKSGSGKSTLTNMLLKQKQNTVFNDDRIIIRKESSGFLLYGTPWHGDVWEYRSGKIPLKKIFFIKVPTGPSFKNSITIQT